MTGAGSDVVSGADGATGGAVGESGVGQVVEDTVEGVAGPESAVGGTVDQTVKGAGEVGRRHGQRHRRRGRRLARSGNR